ncbi:MAG: beta-ketoacyl synthase N-terminal-like domain-containing protein, partial [Thermoplasmatales archaeon]
RNDEPQKASRPWDKNRDGFVIAEGSAVIILESLSSAVKRNARIFAEVVGYGANCDAFHITSPSEQGEGAEKCMRIALRFAGVTPADIDYINAHGTSTPVGDMIELGAIQRVFGDHLHRVSVSSTKSMTGHLLGAAGALESIFCILAINDSFVPPTINLEEPEDGCEGIDLVGQVGRQKEVRAAMNNSFGFGGTNACLIFKRFEA